MILKVIFGTEYNGLELELDNGKSITQYINDISFDDHFRFYQNNNYYNCVIGMRIYNILKNSIWMRSSAGYKSLNNCESLKSYENKEKYICKYFYNDQSYDKEYYNNQTHFISNTTKIIFKNQLITSLATIDDIYIFDFI